MKMWILYKGFFVPCVRLKAYAPASDVNRPELFFPCPEMARHEAAVGVGVLWFNPVLNPAKRRAEALG